VPDRTVTLFHLGFELDEQLASHKRGGVQPAESIAARAAWGRARSFNGTAFEAFRRSGDVVELEWLASAPSSAGSTPRTDRSELDQAVRALKADLLAPGTADLSRILSSTRQAASSAAQSCVRGGLLRPRAFPQTLGFKKTSRCPGAESNHRHGDFQSIGRQPERPVLPSGCR
jgi:hypothetical protein